MINTHKIDGSVIHRSVETVAAHRSAQLLPFSDRLRRFPDLGQQRWFAWLKKNGLMGVPDLENVVARIGDFADPVLRDEVDSCVWQPTTGTWITTDGKDRET